jgi:hypothetical protein
MSEKKLWLSRNGGYEGDYNLSTEKPEYNSIYRVWDADSFLTIPGFNEALVALPPRETKKWLGLEYHLQKGRKGICQIKIGDYRFFAHGGKHEN